MKMIAPLELRRGDVVIDPDDRFTSYVVLSDASRDALGILGVTVEYRPDGGRSRRAWHPRDEQSAIVPVADERLEL